MTVTKDQLTERRRGKGGTIVRLTVDPLTIPPIANALRGFGPIPPHDLRRDTYVVCDLMQRKTWNRPGEIGLKPADLEVAFSVTLDQIEVVG